MPSQEFNCNELGIKAKVDAMVITLFFKDGLPEELQCYQSEDKRVPASSSDVQHALIDFYGDEMKAFLKQCNGYESVCRMPT